MKCRLFILLILLEAATLAVLLTAGHLSSVRSGPARERNRVLVREFELTDLALWTGARYTRHISQADLFAAFQDGMGALERFPAGALAPLPTSIRRFEPVFAVETESAAAAFDEEKNEPAS